MILKFFGLFILALLLLQPKLAGAEYRVFLLKIRQPSADPAEPETIRWVESNLDPEQYRKYYPVYPNEKISYVDTWRCYGRTDSFQQFCKSPRSPAEGPAAQEIGTRPQDQISAPTR